VGLNVTDAKPVSFQQLPGHASSPAAPTTCTDAETFALQVLDASMEPEFPAGCIIIVDPTGYARHGSYVLAKPASSGVTVINRETDQSANDLGDVLDDYVFRQLIKTSDSAWELAPLNNTYSNQCTSADLSDIVGVIVQRAGKRRRLHKHYD